MICAEDPLIDSRGGSHAAGKREGRSGMGARPAGGGRRHPLNR
jgi:hypothetical protein